MRNLPAFTALLCLASPVLAQERVFTTDKVEIPRLPVDAVRAEPKPKPPPIDFKVISSRTRRFDVVEAPPMSGLPPVTGNIAITVRKVEDPGLPDPPPPAPPVVIDDPDALARFEEFKNSYQGPEMLAVSATVYDHSRTFLRIYPNGKTEKTLTAWTNIDFNHFCGFTTYRVTKPDETYTDYSMMMGIGNMDTARIQRFMAKNGQHYEAPEIPELPDIRIAGPDFVVVEGSSKGKAMETLRQLHELYRKEGASLEQAFYDREKAQAERREYFLANPPKPKDVTISFWKRRGPSQIALKELERRQER